MASNSKWNKKNIQKTERQKTSFLKEKKENEGLYKSVLNKIMTTYKERTN